MNPFQAQYPLSPKKLTKKMLPTVIPTIIFSAIVGFFSAFMVIILRNPSGGDFITPIVVLGTMLTIGLSIVILALYSWYFKSFIRSYYYEGADNFITIRKGVFTPREIHVQYQKIQDVYVDQDLLDRIMGLYDVHIASATTSSGMEAHIDGVDGTTAEALKNFFLAKIQSGSQQMQQPGQPAVPGAPMQAAAVPVQLTEQISNQTYPIQGSWMAKSILGAVVSSIFFSTVVGVYTVLPTKEGNPGLFAGHFGTVWLIVFVLYFIFHFFGILLWKKNYSFAFLPEYIQFHTGVISLSETHLPYHSIQDVNISQSIFDRMFGLSNVRIENATQVSVGRYGKMNGGVTIVGISQASASHITEVVKNIILTKNSSGTGL